MFKLQNLSFTKFIFILAGFLILLIVLYLFTLPTKIPRLEITSISPLPGSTNVGFYDPITVEISNNPKYLSLLKLNVELSIIFEASTSSRTVIYTHQKPYKESTRYNVTITQQGQDKPLLSWFFTTKPSQSSTEFINTVEKTNEEYYPLLQYMPIKNQNYEIVYTGRLSLKIIIYTSDVENAKQQALEFVKSKRVDPTTHTITWVEMVQ